MITESMHIRNELLPGDIERIVRYHNEYYAERYGFNHDFGKYVEDPLIAFYDRNGFALEEENRVTTWGRELVEQRYGRRL